MTEEDTFPESIDEEARRRFEHAWSIGRPEPIDGLLPDAADPRYLDTLEELVAIELEFAWRTAASRARVEDYLARFPRLTDPAVTLRLVREEYHARHRFGDRPALDEFRSRFPELVRTGRELGEPPPPDAAARLPEVPGYRVSAVLGRGGMGVVYRARDLRLDREVALKMLLAGPEATPSELARFRAEAAAVARLQHPNIVEIHEAGEHEGRPYFALELVDGGNLARALAAAEMPARDAAALVATIARAVQRAHDGGVVHRDLKPANVLLTTDGTPKISDFGVAKIVAEREGADSLHTRTGEVIGTPAYMAPEQAAGHSDRVGPPADIYALGAILYEALTGRPPFCGDTPYETVAQVLVEEPISPVRLRPRLPRDLETICLKCLEKSPARRYASAEELADDLDRYLAGEPIRARPISLFGRGVKWARRKPMAAALAGFVGLALAGVVVGSVWYSGHLAETLARETALREAAEASLREARDAVDRMLTRVAEAQVAKIPQAERVVERLLEDALGFYEGFVVRHGERPDLQRETARAHRRLGDIRVQLGRVVEGEGAYRTAIEILEGVTRAEPAGREGWIDLADAQNNLGNLFLASRRAPQALASYETAIAICARLVDEAPSDPLARCRLAQYRHGLGSMLSFSSRHAEAEPVLRAAAADLEALVEEHPRDPDYADQLARTQHNLGLYLRNHGRQREAVPILERSVALKEALARTEVASPRIRSELGTACSTLGIVLWDLGEDGRARAAYEKAIEVQGRLVDEFPAFPDYASGLAASLHNLGELVLERDVARAAELFERAIEHQRAALRANPRDPTYLQHAYNHHWAAAEAMAELGRHARAAELARALPSFLPERAEGYRLAAKLVCRAIYALAGDGGIGEQERRRLAAAYADAAVGLLREAVAHGLTERASIVEDADFEPLGEHAGYRELVESVR